MMKILEPTAFNKQKEGANGTRTMKQKNLKPNYESTRLLSQQIIRFRYVQTRPGWLSGSLYTFGPTGYRLNSGWGKKYPFFYFQ